MASLTETITIVNNSGKIISTGKHLVGLFKDAKAAYQNRKGAIAAEKGAIERCYAYDPVENRYYEVFDNTVGDTKSKVALARTKVSVAPKNPGTSKTGAKSTAKSIRSAPNKALTEANLERLTVVSASTQRTSSKASDALTVAKSSVKSMAASQAAPAPSGVLVNRSAAPLAAALPRISTANTVKDIDMDLAYGNVPPDLATRVDLDASYDPGTQADRLVGKIEKLLEEAHCLHHSASHVIAQLQSSPERAAAVALALAELSALTSKMQPSFLALLKGGSPTVFALLASPQFLIAAGVAVGVTVVMFGGWKIIKRIQDMHAAHAIAMPVPASLPPASVAPSKAPTSVSRHPTVVPPTVGPAPTRPALEGGFHTGRNDALVVDENLEQLSVIDSWRRGIVPFGEDEKADLELISPDASHVLRERHRESRSKYDGDDAATVTAHDSISQVGGDRRRRSHHSRHGGGSGSGHGEHKRSSSSSHQESTLVLHKSSKTHHSSAKSHVSGNSSSSRHKSDSRDDDTKSTHSHKSHRSSSSVKSESKTSKKTTDGGASNMLKSMFKNIKEKEGRSSSKLVLEKAR